MLTPGQDHDLAGARPLLENADPRALIGDKAYDADSLIDTLKQRAITRSFRRKPTGRHRATAISCSTASTTSSSASSTKSSISALSPPIRQTRQKLSRRRSVGLRFGSSQLKTGPRLIADGDLAALESHR
jgi:IS5 family transposase